jgi:hypothetical protein
MALTTNYIGSSNTTVYDSQPVSPSIGNAITCMVICNTSNSTSANLTVYAVPAAAGPLPGTASNANMMINTLIIPPGETVSLDQEKLVLGARDTIVAVSSVNNGLTITISTLPV